jgi:putative Holliday junction resolvase
MPRILALDFGLKRIGAAISDPTGTFASPLEVYERRNERLDAAHYEALVRDERIERIVVGLPVFSSGDESPLSRQARAWGRWLGERTAVPVVYRDERYTTREAEQLLLESGLRGKALKSRRDMLAAQLLLQGYLDAGSPLESTPPGPLDERA